MTLSYTVSDGAAGTPNTATIVVQGANDPAQIDGAASGAVTEDGETTASGQLTVVDNDAGEAGFSPVFSDGWRLRAFLDGCQRPMDYRLDNANAQVQAMRRAKR